MTILSGVLLPPPPQSGIGGLIGATGTQTGSGGLGARGGGLGGGSGGVAQITNVTVSGAIPSEVAEMVVKRNMAAIRP